MNGPTSTFSINRLTAAGSSLILDDTLYEHVGSLFEYQVPTSQSAIRRLFVQNTPRRSYLSRMKAAFSANYLDKLDRIQVPTLVLTPAYERLIGENAARQLVEGIADAVEVVLPDTGHMFRSSGS